MQVTAVVGGPEALQQSLCIALVAGMWGKAPPPVARRVMAVVVVEGIQVLAATPALLAALARLQLGYPELFPEALLVMAATAVGEVARVVMVAAGVMQIGTPEAQVLALPVAVVVALGEILAVAGLQAEVTLTRAVVRAAARACVTQGIVALMAAIPVMAATRGADPEALMPLYQITDPEAQVMPQHQGPVAVAGLEEPCPLAVVVVVAVVEEALTEVVVVPGIPALQPTQQRLTALRLRPGPRTQS